MKGNFIMSQLETDFDKVAQQINAKIQEATKVLQELNVLKDQAGLPSLINGAYLQDHFSYKAASKKKGLDQYQDFLAKLELLNVRELETQIDYAGWSTSSSYC
jgi:hypothetical protein